MASKPDHVKLLEDWMKSYKPHELFDAKGTLVPELQALSPQGVRRMGSNPHANGGLLRRVLKMPEFRQYAVEVPKPATVMAEATRCSRPLPSGRHDKQSGESEFSRPSSRRINVNVSAPFLNHKPCVDG